MAYKVERNLFLDGTEYAIGDVIELANDDRTKSLVESGTLSTSDAKATPAKTVDEGVDTSTTPPLSESVAAGPQEPSIVSPESTPEPTPEPEQPVNQPSNTPEPPASSETTSVNLHLG